MTTVSNFLSHLGDPANAGVPQNPQPGTGGGASVSGHPPFRPARRDEQGRLVVIEPGRYRNHASLGREPVNLLGPTRFVPIDAAFTRGGVQATFGSAPVQTI